jgi:RNA polymerase sigma-70 factor, ECF subfamily
LQPKSTKPALTSLMAADLPAAADLLDLHYRSRFEHIAANAGVPRGDCPDVAQDALIAALGQIERGIFRGDSSIGTWLFTIVKGKIADYHRAHARANLQASDNANVALADGVTSPSAEVRVLVQDALRRLPSEHRAILLLNQQGGLTIEDIAHRLGRSRGRVGAMLAEAKPMFRDHARPSEKFEPRARLIE